MSLHMTDSEACARVAADPDSETARKVLAARVYIQIIRRLPNPVGTCAHGRRVYTDQCGVYSLGYVCHDDDHSLCNGGHGFEVVWHQQPERERLLALMRSLR